MKRLQTLSLIVILLTGTGSLLANSNRTMADLNNIAAGIESYRMQTGSLPSSDDGLEVFVKRPENLSQEIEWKQMMSKVPLDPWGNSYKLIMNTDLPKGYGIYSKGPDGISRTIGNDPDDYNTWSPDYRRIETNPFKNILWLWPLVSLGCVLCFYLGLRTGKYSNP
ncbi:MAG: type II secretion system protein GspG [Verrucomicrobiota bacterium]